MIDAIYQYLQTPHPTTRSLHSQRAYQSHNMVHSTYLSILVEVVESMRILLTAYEQVI